MCGVVTAVAVVIWLDIWEVTMNKREAEITLKSIEALQQVGAQISIRLTEIDKILVAADELLSEFKISIEQQLEDINRG